MYDSLVVVNIICELLSDDDRETRQVLHVE